MAATRRPPNAGFHASNCVSPVLTTLLTSRPTASPVRPAPSRAAVRPPTSRPHAVLGRRTAHGSVPLAHFASLARLSGVRLFSLQVGPGAEQVPHAGFPILQDALDNVERLVVPHADELRART